MPGVSGSGASVASTRPTANKQPKEFPTPAKAISIRTTLNSLADSERGYGGGGGYGGASSTSSGRGGGGGAGRVTAAPSAGSTPRPTSPSVSPGRTRNN